MRNLSCTMGGTMKHNEFFCLWNMIMRYKFPQMLAMHRKWYVPHNDESRPLFLACFQPALTSPQFNDTIGFRQPFQNPCAVQIKTRIKLGTYITSFQCMLSPLSSGWVLCYWFEVCTHFHAFSWINLSPLQFTIGFQILKFC